MLQDYVITPRDEERAQPGQRHLYDKEPFGLRHKTFWGLDMTQNLLTKFIQKLTHESDGLIFQPVGFNLQCRTAMNASTCKHSAVLHAGHHRQLPA